MRECKPKLDIRAHSRKTKKAQEYQHIIENRCSQYLDTCWTKGNRVVEGVILQYRNIKNYLRIENNICIDYNSLFGRHIFFTIIDKEYTQENDPPLLLSPLTDCKTYLKKITAYKSARNGSTITKSF